MSGYDVCKIIRKQYSINELPVIFLTAKNQVNDLVHSFAIGANDYLTKPVSKPELLTRVETQLKLLDTNRNLEQKVSDRTEQLDESNSQLARTIKDLNSTQIQLVEAEKMASLGNLVNGVAHELNTPLGVITTSASIVEKHCNDTLQQIVDNHVSRSVLIKTIENIQKAGEIISYNISRTADLTRSFKLVSANYFDEKTSALKIGDVIDSVINLLNIQLKAKDIAIHLDGDREQSLCCYKNSLALVFEQLILNSITHAFPESIKNPSIEIKFWLDDMDSYSQLNIHYTDNGIGLDYEAKNKIFEPFFTTNRADCSIGLGMHIVYNHVTHKMNGVVDIDENYQNGFSSYITIPITTSNP